jgi:hypothetical protein
VERLKATATTIAVALLHLGLVGLACSSGSGPLTMPTAGTSGSSMGAAGTGAAGTGTAGTGTAGTASLEAAGSPGTTGSAGTGAAGTAAAAGTTGSAAGTGAAGTAAAAGTTGSAGTGAAGTAGVDITKVVPAPGCGKDPGQPLGTAVHGTVLTMGTKDPDCAARLGGQRKCGPWALEREYFVTLPQGYVKTRAYPLILLGPGCGGTGTNIYALDDGVGGPANVGNTVIRVGLTPAPNSIGHGTNENQGCFDDKEGDDSVDWVFYENLWDKLAGQICFDKNRVFAAGNSSGAWLANELGCKYAGDATHPIRGVMPNAGGLPTDPRWVPTCTTHPLAGVWVHEVNDGTAGFNLPLPINRALKVNDCMPSGVTYATAMYDPFPIGGGNADGTCKKARGCPELYPIVVCPLAGNGHGSHDAVVNPGFSTFVKLFSAPALLTP